MSKFQKNRCTLRLNQRPLSRSVLNTCVTSVCVEPSHALPRAMTIIAFSGDHQGKDFFICYKDVLIPSCFQAHVFALYKKRGQQPMTLSLFLSRLFMHFVPFLSSSVSRQLSRALGSLRPLWKCSWQQEKISAWSS